MRLLTKGCNSSWEGTTVRGGGAGARGRDPAGSRSRPRRKDSLGRCMSRAALPLLRRPFALGTAFLCCTVPYGNRVTSACARAAAVYITNQQKGLRCARLLGAPARATARGSMLPLPRPESRVCFYFTWFRQSQTSIWTTFKHFRVACCGTGERKPQQTTLLVLYVWIHYREFTAKPHCWILNRSCYLLRA